MEPLIPKRENTSDESIAAFSKRRFGNSYYREMIIPVARGILMADPAELSLQAYFSEWSRMEKEHGSISAGLFKNRKNPEQQSKPFFTIRNGLEKLIESLVKRLPETRLRPDSAVTHIERDEKWKVFLHHGQVIEADAVCIALPAPMAEELLADQAPKLCRGLSQIRYDDLIVVNMVYRCADLSDKWIESGFIIPKDGKKTPFASLKFVGLTEDGLWMRVKAFISGTFQPGMSSMADQEILREVLTYLGGEWDVRTPPCWTKVMRYPRSLAIYSAGHKERIDRIQAETARYPGLFLTGNGYEGFGIADCMRGGVRAAEAMRAYLETFVVAS